MMIYIVYWNSYAVFIRYILFIGIHPYAAFDDYRQLRIPLPLTKRQMM